MKRLAQTERQDAMDRQNLDPIALRTATAQASAMADTLREGPRSARHIVVFADGSWAVPSGYLS